MSNFFLASQFQSELDSIRRMCPNVDTVLMDLGPSFEELEKAVTDCDLVIRLDVQTEVTVTLPSIIVS